jgi:hypothetical protein
MTFIFTALGVVFFVAIGYRFVTRMTTKEPAASRAK